MATLKTIDLGPLRESLQNEVVVLGIVRTCLADTPGRLAAIAKALGEGDVDRMALEAHALKGAASYLGLEVFGDACLQLERAARGAPADFGSLVDDVVTRWREVEDALRAELPEA